MSGPNDTRLLALLGLRLKGFGTVAAVAEVVDAEPEVIERELALALDEGLVVFGEQRQVYMLNPAEGRLEGERLLSEQLDRLDACESVSVAYQAFLSFNPRMLGLCTDWQIKQTSGERALNDHNDPGYDSEVVDRLIDLDAEFRPILVDLTEAVGRYCVYGPRFDNALRLLKQGDLDYFTKPILPSYHTVWFELHEDLLATLGIDRSTEGSS